MDLIICNTPLQVLQLETLINKNIIKEKNFHLIFFYYNDSEKLHYYYNRLAKHSCSSIYYKYQAFPFYIFFTAHYLKNKKFKNIYTASVDNKLIHYILSYVAYDKFFTVDDGTANIWRNSCYYINRTNKIKSLIHTLCGCKFDLNKTKEEIALHYSIYPHMSNITNKIKHNEISLSPPLHSMHCKNEKINIFLGTVYDEITSDKTSLIQLISNFLRKDNFLYIPHPRDMTKYFNNIEYIDSNLIAEEFILQKLASFSEIYLYGFNSSAQINLSGFDKIKNFHLTSSTLTQHIQVDNFVVSEINLDI